MILDLKSIFKAFVLLFKNNINVRRAVYGTLSFVIVLTLFVSVFSVTDLTYAVEVSVEGESCGYVTDRKTVDRAVNILHESSVENDVDYSTPTVDCVYTIVSSSQLISPDELADNIVSNDNSVNKVACVVINGIAFAKVDSVEDGVAALSGIAGNNRFYNLVEIRECVLSAEAKSRLKSLDERINDYIVTDVEYQTVEGDTKQSVAEKFGISEDNIPDFNVNDVISIKASLPAFAFINKITTQTKQSIPASETVAKSSWQVTIYEEVYVNNIKLRTQFVGTEITEKFPDKPIATAVVNAGNKGYCWPVDTGYRQYVSSFWGDDRGHKGYDIAASKGTPILSLYGGKVVSINSSGDAYGLHFVIDHGNGIKTLYAHCSKLYVSLGDRVERGEVVGLVGATGRVTGSHLHFEVYRNGVQTNPMNYIGKR